MKTTSLILAAFAALPLTLSAQEKKTPRVQIALLLDNSGSMSGLINQARTQLWKVVNEFISAKRDGMTPEVEVALYKYGASPELVTPLTRDLDLVSRALFALQINGGTEYCGATIKDATEKLSWSSDKDVYRVIFIAGNEPFTQGPVEPATACKLAISKGIIVNTIHCGSDAEGISGGWKNGALLADGSYMIIDQNSAVAQVSAPQDTEIVKLSEKLNKTYVRYGKSAGYAAENQIAQDNNAKAAAPAAGVARALTKSCARIYDNSGWDLVDALDQKKVKLEEVKKEELPAELAKLSAEELKAHVEKQAAGRKAIQEKIQSLNKDREAYIATELKKKGEGQSLDVAMIKAIRSQAQKQQFSFPEEK
ncbi:MAG TPA: vWA domain-containing protein [Verrucomicrobiales bacterium]|nr:vWA domain-containing protein [Verrucomicrobiales bacterium]